MGGQHRCRGIDGTPGPYVVAHGGRTRQPRHAPGQPARRAGMDDREPRPPVDPRGGVLPGAPAGRLPAGRRRRAALHRLARRPRRTPRRSRQRGGGGVRRGGRPWCRGSRAACGARTWTASSSAPREPAPGRRDRGSRGQCLLDMRVRPMGSHHQKLVVVRHACATGATTSPSSAASTCATAVATTARHGGDPQKQAMAAVYGRRPAVARRAAAHPGSRRRRRWRPSSVSAGRTRHR